MKTYRIRGYAKPIGKENEDWQKIGESAEIELADDVNPYQVIQSNFNLIASNWMFTVDEIKKKE